MFVVVILYDPLQGCAVLLSSLVLCFYGQWFFASMVAGSMLICLYGYWLYGRPTMVTGSKRLWSLVIWSLVKLLWSLVIWSLVLQWDRFYDIVL